MNTKDITYLLNNPFSINEKQTMDLEIVLQQYPFFQSLKALHLKGLYNQDSFRYNYELKKTAAHTTDRSILFDFITSENFTTLQKNNIENIDDYINNITVVDSVFLKMPTAVSEIKLEEKEIQTEILRLLHNAWQKDSILRFGTKYESGIDSNLTYSVTYKTFILKKNEKGLNKLTLETDTNTLTFTNEGTWEEVETLLKEKFFSIKAIPAYSTKSKEKTLMNKIRFREHQRS